jgi:hypothetical protein
VCRHRACANDQRRSPPIALLKAWLARALPAVRDVAGVDRVASHKFSLRAASGFDHIVISYLH